jgi:glycosyltransferase involved in cell wall biosynthesis
MSSPPPSAEPQFGSSGSASRKVLLCLSHLRWKFVFQRPQHLLTRAARTYRVLYVEEPIFKGSSKPFFGSSAETHGITVYVPVFPEGFAGEVNLVLEEMIERLVANIEPADLVLWYYTPMALQFTRHLSAAAIVYDNMDELSAFRDAPPKLLALESELLDRADIVFTGGHSIYEAKRHRHRNIHPFPSSIDVLHFSAARRSPGADPADQAAIPHPRLGFFGVVDERMDLDLVDGIAGLRPDWHIVMLGPVVKIDKTSLPRRANIHWLGMKPYDELPYYLAGWEIGIMPFAINEATRFISPTKTPEFLAAGLPVISTPIRDVIRPYGAAGLVEIASTAQGFVSKADTLMRERDLSWLQAVDRQLATTSWDRTWESMEAKIDGCRMPPPPFFTQLEKGVARV